MDLPIWAETWLIKATETATKRSAFETMFLFGNFARLRAPRTGVLHVQKKKKKESGWLRRDTDKRVTMTTRKGITR
jgi:hypothetical protein